MGGSGGSIVMLGCMGFFLQRDYACNVETGEVQVRLCVCHPICVYVDHTFCHSCLLGIWRPAFDKCKCPSLAAQKRCSWSCCCSHANSSGNLKWFSANLTVDGCQGSKKRNFSFSVMSILTRKMPVIGLFVGFAVTPLYFVWEKLIGVHATKNMLLCAVCCMPVILPVWFFAIAFPFFGPINSTVGAMFVTFTVYIIPCAAHMSVFRTAKQGMAGKKQHFLKKPWSKWWKFATWKFATLSFCEKNPLHSFGSQKNDTEADEVTILSLAAECCCEAPFLHVELGSNLPHQHIHHHLDSGNWHWSGWLGKHHNFQAWNRNIRCICPMLSMPTNSCSSHWVYPKLHSP